MGNVLAIGDKNKELKMSTGMENILLFMGGDFKFYCLQLKNPERMLIQLKNFSVSPMGDAFLVDFSTGSVTRGCFKIYRQRRTMGGITRPRKKGDCHKLNLV